MRCDATRCDARVGLLSSSLVPVARQLFVCLPGVPSGLCCADSPGALPPESTLASMSDAHASAAPCVPSGAFFERCFSRTLYVYCLLFWTAVRRVASRRVRVSSASASGRRSRQPRAARVQSMRAHRSSARTLVEEESRGEERSTSRYSYAEMPLSSLFLLRLSAGRGLFNAIRDRNMKLKR